MRQTLLLLMRYAVPKLAALQVVTVRRASDLPPTWATGVDMTPHMPTNPQNMRRVLYNDLGWWSDRANDVNDRVSAWLAR